MLKELDNKYLSTYQLFELSTIIVTQKEERQHKILRCYDSALKLYPPKME